MKHYVTNKKLSEISELLILIQKGDFKHYVTNRKNGFWCHCFLNWEFSKETELKGSPERKHYPFVLPWALSLFKATLLCVCG